jgi:hypothetical protein
MKTRRDRIQSAGRQTNNAFRYIGKKTYPFKAMMITSVTKGRDTEIVPPKKHLRLSKHTDMTIHWKGLEEHFLMVPLVFRFNHAFSGEKKINFLNFSKKNLNP